MSGKYTASLVDMQVWAQNLMTRRAPDFVIGDNYLRRWWVIPRNDQCNVYLHEINQSDDDRALHDHPWDNSSWLLQGGYLEITPEGEFQREEGSRIDRSASDAHRLVVPNGGRVISLFITGPEIREWGFHCPQGWRHWKDFTAYSQTGGSGQVGRGCD